VNGRVAVTGATGFLGSHLVAALCRAGFSASCLVRGAARGGDLRDAGCDVVAGDLDDPAALARLVAGAEVIFHVAGLVAARDEDSFFRVNRDGTARMIEAARHAPLRRFVYVSSLAVSGPARLGAPVADDGTAAPVTPYGRSKQAGEDAVRASGLPFTILRPPAVYGPADRQFLRLFRLARLGVLPLLGDGTQELSLVHVHDLAAGALAAAESPVCAQGTYHITHGEIVSQRALLAAVGEATGRRARLVPMPAALVRQVLRVSGTWGRLRGTPTLLSPDKAPELLAPAWTCRADGLTRDAQWTAAIPLREGLSETALWYRSAGWL
jgi:nucleoside-diphosphate-sugar epimerase